MLPRFIEPGMFMGTPGSAAGSASAVGGTVNAPARVEPVASCAAGDASPRSARRARAGAQEGGAVDEGWDFYFCTLDDAPASIALDLGYVQRGADAARPTLLCVRVRLRRPRPDGLSDGDEAADLNGLEDRVTASLAARCDAVAVGRLTSAGRREFFFYGRSDAELAAALDEAAAGGPYAPLFRAEVDPDWRFFFDVLAPGDREWQWILDRRVVDQLRAHGDDLDAARPVDHFVDLPDAEARDAFEAAIAEDGFSVSRAHAGFGLRLQRADAVRLDRIHPVTWALGELARRLGGAYDGWGAPLAEQSD